MATFERLTPWERALQIVTHVRAEETSTALLMTLNGFLLLMAYSCIKPVRDALILAHPGGAEYKVYMAGATAVVLLVGIPAYARISRGLTRDRLVVGVTAFFASHLVAFYVLGTALGPALSLALAFYLWIAVFNMMIVAQFWAFASDLYSEEAGKRLFPLIGLGASIGALAGAAAATVLIATVGVMGMMLLAAAILIISAGVSHWVHQREARNPRSDLAREAAVSPIGGSASDAFRTVLKTRYLLLIAVFSLVFTLVKTNGDYVLARLVEEAANRSVAAGPLQMTQMQNFIGTFFANYTFRIDALSLLLQAFVVSRLVKRFGLGSALYVLPVIALADAGAMATWPVLAGVSIGKTAESAADYSINSTARNMLWLPTTRRAKYLAKQTVDSIFVRAGDVCSAILVFVAVQEFRLSVQTFAIFNVVLVMVWLLLVRGILRERVLIGRAKGESSPLSSPEECVIPEVGEVGS